MWSSPAWSTTGASVRQMSWANGQRGWKRQPEGGLIGLGGSPRSCRTTSLSPCSARSRGQQHPRVRVPRPREQLVAGRDLDDLPEVHDRDAVAQVANDAKVVGDQHQCEVELVLQLDEQVEDLGPDRCVQRRCRLVADQELRLSRSARAITIRCSWPPEHSCGLRSRIVLFEARPGRACRHPLPPLVPALHAVVAQRRLEAGAERHPGIEGAVRVLEDELHRTTQRLELLAVGLGDVVALEHDVARGRRCGSEDGPRQRALAAPGFADEAEHLTLADLEGHPVHGVDLPALAGGEVLDQVLDLDEWPRRGLRTVLVGRGGHPASAWSRDA